MTDARRRWPSAAWGSACGRSTASRARSCSTGSACASRSSECVFRGTQERLPRRRRRRAAPSRRRSKLAGPARQATGKPRGLFDLTPDEEQQMLQRGGRATSPPRRSARRRSRPTPPARRRPSCSPRPTSSGVDTLGVPEELGGVDGRAVRRHRRAGRRGARPRRHGDRLAALAPGAVATRDRALGQRRAAGDLPARLHRRGRRRAAALAILEPRPLFDPLQARDDARAATAATGSSTASSRSCRGRPSCELFVVAARGRGASARRCSSSSPSTDGLSVEPEPAMGLRAAATGRLILEGVRAAGRRAAGRGRAATSTSSACSRARIAWCALAVGAAQAVLDYVIPYVNERSRLRRADLQPPGGRLRGLRHRDRARGHAPRRPTAPRAAPTRARTSPARRRSRAACCAAQGRCGSAPTACSCSAATATSRSTRSSAGTATCARRA